MDIAIITGASSGLGREYARLLNESKDCPDELWLIARREDRLQALAQELKAPCQPLALDLTDPAALDTIEKRLAADETLHIKWLINAAGFGRIGSYADIGRHDLMQMLDLNCRAAAALTQLALPYMGRGSHIMEICSCAAFQPIPYLAAYAASKAFLLSYSRSLGAEVAPRGIKVTAVCPYWVKDTEFVVEARRTDAQHIFKDFPLAGTQRTIARRSLAAARKGCSVCTPDMVSSLHRLLTTLVPHALMLQLSNLYRRFA